MPRGTCTFRQRNVEAAIKAATAAGIKVARIDIDRDGKITIIADRDAGACNSGSEWDSKYGADQTEIR